MWVIFEGLDKAGKTTLEWDLHRATNFKNVVIDRGPVGYMVFDKIFDRETEDGTKEYFKQIEMVNDSEDFMVIYCTVNKEVAKDRLKVHDEKCPYNYEEAQKLYKNYVYDFYKNEKIIEVDTTFLSVEECTEIIVKKLKEIAYGKDKKSN